MQQVPDVYVYCWAKMPESARYTVVYSILDGDLYTRYWSGLKT